MLDEDKFQTLLVLGFLFRRLGQAKKAEDLYRALIAIRPDDLSLLAPAAAAALDEGRAEEALDMLDRLEGRVPSDLRLANWLLRAKALSALGRQEEAEVMTRMFLDARSMSAPTPSDGQL